MSFRHQLYSSVAATVMAALAMGLPGGCNLPAEGQESDIAPRVMAAGLAVPDRLLAPVGRGAHWRILRRRRLRIADRVFHLRRGVAFRVEDWNEVRAFLSGPIELAVGVDGGFAPVRRNLIVEVGRWPAPIPQRENHIALDPTRPLRLCKWKLPGCNAVGPVSEQVKCKLRVQPPDHIDHLRHRLPGLNAPFPCVRRGTELTQFFRDRARSDGAKGTARHAAGGLYDIHPLGLNFQVVRHVLAPLRTRKLALGWDLEHRVPIDCRIIVCRGARIWRR